MKIPDKAQAFFSVAMHSEVGDGASTLFWQDRWLHGQRVADLALQLFAAISKRRVNKRTVKEALIEHTWISDITGALTVGVLAECLQLWNILGEVELQ
jgi:lipopolysaccharide/colanic/teichoic acid biosynthesis glycosyltransferase